MLCTSNSSNEHILYINTETNFNLKVVIEILILKISSIKKGFTEPCESFKVMKFSEGIIYRTRFGCFYHLNSQKFFMNLLFYLRMSNNESWAMYLNMLYHIVLLNKRGYLIGLSYEVNTHQRQKCNSYFQN